LILSFILSGCSIVGSFVFKTKHDVTDTPARYGIPYTNVWFPAPDGVQLNGWLVPGSPSMPPILFFHGNGGNLSDNVQYVNLLHQQGFTIFVFDYRGFGESRGRAHSEKELYKDARGAIAYLQKTGWRHEETIYYGQSMGGAVALQMALEMPPVALVMESTFTSMADMAKYHAPAPYYLLFWWCFDLGFDNAHKIAKTNVPVLLIHGDRDPVAPVRMAHALYDNAVEPKTLHIIPGGGHCNAFELQTGPYQETWSSFLSTISARAPSGKAAQLHR